MSKAKIIDKKCIDSILGEKSLLSELHHPFIVNMIYSFQDHDYLYLVMDLLPGGNLRYHLGIRNSFNERQIKFLIGCIMIGLKYIHGQKILHRDIKPENLVFDHNGYLRITDFGIAKHYVVNNKKDTSGTVGYLAPEVLCNVNHNYSIDYYAVGIITYELMYGHRPYIGKTKHEVKQLILTRQAEIDYDDLPDGFSNDIADFINKLIQRKPKNRLGKDSIYEVIEHPWFNEFDWDNVAKKKTKAPYLPKFGDNFDKKYCLKANKIGTDTMERYKNIMKEENYNSVFKEFDCTKIPDELKGFKINLKNDSSSANNNNNNVTSNISTTTISRNNKNENKDNNFINNLNNNLSNKHVAHSKMRSKINHHDNNNNNNNNIEIKLNPNNLMRTSNNISKNYNIISQVQKSSNNQEIFNNSSNILKKKDNRIEIKKPDDDMNRNYLQISGHMKHNNNNNDSEYIYNINQKDEEFHPSISVNNLNIKNPKNLLQNSTIEVNHNNNSIVTINSGILKNMKYQYKELNPNKKGKFTSYSSKNIKLEQNQISNKNHTINNKRVNNNLYSSKMDDKNLFQLSNNQQIKRSINLSAPKSKKEYTRKEILKCPPFQESEIGTKKPTQLLMSSTIYARKKINSTNNSLISNSKRLASSHSMRNLKAINNGSLNLYIQKQKQNIFDKTGKDLSLVNKKLPFINKYINKKKDNINFGNDAYYLSYGKFINAHDKMKGTNEYDYLTDRMKNKRIKTNSTKINYNNKSANNFFSKL